jgi:membrane protein DedA with SNARE-associated domain/membrane-associated phospholipid phosphatase
VKPLWLLGAAALAAFLVVRRRQLERPWLAAGALATLAVALVGLGVIPVPDLQALIEDVGGALGPWTYVFVGVLAFLETGAFVGLIAPGETTVLVGGVVAGQGEIDLLALIAIVWSCAVAGDVTSYVLGRRLGREFLVRHGARVKITESRLQQVEAFFARRGGATILVGRFVGLVRALAPFLAGASRMPLRTFLPYDVLGAGLWAALFSLLGYLFWRSLDTVTRYVSQGLFAFGFAVALVVGGLYARRLTRDEAERARARRWLEARPGGALVLRAGGHAARPARFAYQRLTPGDLGLELTTLLALAAVGAFTFFGLEALLEDRVVLPLDREAFSIARSLRTAPVVEVVRVATDLGSLAVTSAAVLATAAWALVRRSGVIEAGALVLGHALTYVVVHVAKEALARPRPAQPLVETTTFAFPSGHSAYAVAFVACAVVLVRAGHGLALRFAAVSVAVVLAAGVALSRVYLRAHYLSDTLAGAAVGVAIYSLVGIVAVVVAFLRHNPRGTA